MNAADLRTRLLSAVKQKRPYAKVDAQVVEAISQDGVGEALFLPGVPERWRMLVEAGGTYRLHKWTIVDQELQSAGLVPERAKVNGVEGWIVFPDAL